MDSANQIFKECLAARKNCALFDHPNRGVIEVRGTDRTQFLHNTLSNDIKSLTPAKGLTACLLNAQAKVIANLNVLGFDEFLWLTLDYSLKAELLESLNKMIIMEQVELIDRSNELKLISVHGPKAKELLSAIVKEDSLPEEFLSHRRITIGEASAIVIRINLTGETGYGFLIPNDRAASIRTMLGEKGASAELIEIQAPTLETLRIEAGIPRYGIDFDHSHIPLEARLEKSISFTKGCFPGQEILARLDSRGGVGKKLMGFELKGKSAPKRNDRITKDGKEVGSITSSVFSPMLKKTVGLGYLKKECWTIGCPVVIESQEGPIPARVASLPFYSPHTS